MQQEDLQTKIINAYRHGEWAPSFKKDTGPQWLSQTWQATQLSRIVGQGPLLLADACSNDMRFLNNLLSGLDEGMNATVFANDISYAYRGEPTFLFECIEPPPNNTQRYVYAKDYYQLELPQQVHILLDRLGVAYTSVFDNRFYHVPSKPIIEKYFKKANNLLQLGGALVMDAHPKFSLAYGKIPFYSSYSLIGEALGSDFYDTINAHGFKVQTMRPARGTEIEKGLATIAVFTKVSELGVTHTIRNNLKRKLFPSNHF